MSEKNPHAVALGQKGGAKRSAAKTAAARRNGQKGGRPVRTGQPNGITTDRIPAGQVTVATIAPERFFKI